MPESLLFRLGARVGCADGDCGTIKSLIVEPGTDAVTHLLVEPASRQVLGRLVPLSLVEVAPAGTGEAGDEVRLRCTEAEFEELDPAETTEVIPGYPPSGSNSGDIAWPHYAPGAMGGPGLPDDSHEASQVVIVDAVPDQLPGEDEVVPGEHVHAKDGDIGHVRGILVDPGTGRVTAVLLQERHHLRRRTVLIPRSSVANVDADGFHLDLTTEQVRDLPPAGLDHPAG
jgi:hypothetical protein